MSDLSVMKARERELKNILFDNHNDTNLDLYNINYSELQPHVFQSNSSFASYVESFQPNSSYATEIDEWSQLFQMMISWQDMLLVAVFCAFIVITIIGNTLVIMAVITTRRLKTVTNCFVMSLAVADLLVGIFVMPPAVAVHLKVPTSNQLEMLATRNKNDESATYQTWEDKEIKFDIPNLQNRYRNGEMVLATINHIEDSKGNPGDTGSMLATNLRIIWHSLVHKKFNLWSWQLGWVLCDIWISLDVLLCTASILSLCAISVDRYLAVTQPLTYSRKRRSKRLALVMILIVWTVALAITCPPMFGWYEPGRRDLNECRYNQNEGYVIFSAMGSFFIPMAVMIYVYARISCVVASRHDNMTDISIHNKKFKRYTSTQTEGDMEGDCSEQDISPSQKRQSAARTLSNQTIAKELHEVVGLDEKDLITKSGSYELVASTLCTQSIKRQSSVTSKNSPSIEQHYSFSGLQRHSMRHHINTTTPYANDTYITRNVRVHHQKSLSNRISLLKKENKTTQTLSIVVGGFIACWLPFFINYLITPFLDEAHVSRTIAKVLTWLGWFNSAINPFIYAFYSVDFRAAFWRLTLKRIFRSSSKTRFPSNIGTMSIRR